MWWQFVEEEKCCAMELQCRRRSWNGRENKSTNVVATWMRWERENGYIENGESNCMGKQNDKKKCCDVGWWIGCLWLTFKSNHHLNHDRFGAHNGKMMTYKSKPFDFEHFFNRFFFFPSLLFKKPMWNFAFKQNFATL